MKVNGQMLFSCGHCKGCPPITDLDEYKREMKKIIEGAFNSRPEDLEIVECILNMRVYLVRCPKHERVLYFLETGGR